MSTTGQPAAMAGPNLCATRLSGKLKGAIAPTTPTGTRMMKPILPTPTGEASIGTTSPVKVRATAAENCSVLTARSTSTRAVLIGLADSRAIAIPKSSRREARSTAARSRISARCHCGNGDVSSVRCAYSTAASTSAGLSAGTEPSSASSNGERTSMEAPEPVVQLPVSSTGDTRD